MTILEVRNLRTYFLSPEGVVKAVDGVDLALNERKTLGLVGESGCGKSTLGFSILGLIPPPGRMVEGNILFKGEDLTKKRGKELRKIRGKKISMVFQNPYSSLNPVMRIKDHFLESFKVHEKVSDKEAWKISLDILTKLRIKPERAMDYPHELSGGMRQRVMLGLALLHHPELLIADEPTTALDVVVQAQILDLLRELKEAYKLSLILITHDLGVVAEMADEVGVMYAGKLVEWSKAEELYQKPLHPYTQGLLNSIPKFHLSQDPPKVIPGSPPDLIHLPRGCRFYPRCDRGKEICQEEEPCLKEVSSGHVVACHVM
jgi:oligopeptide/dipeptide ABC transporter ATP-binding protein